MYSLLNRFLELHLQRQGSDERTLIESEVAYRKMHLDLLEQWPQFIEGLDRRERQALVQHSLVAVLYHLMDKWLEQKDDFYSAQLYAEILRPLAFFEQSIVFPSWILTGLGHYASRLLKRPDYQEIRTCHWIHVNMFFTLPDKQLKPFHHPDPILAKTITKQLLTHLFDLSDAHGRPSVESIFVLTILHNYMESNEVTLDQATRTRLLNMSIRYVDRFRLKHKELRDAFGLSIAGATCHITTALMAGATPDLSLITSTFIHKLFLLLKPMAGAHNHFHGLMTLAAFVHYVPETRLCFVKEMSSEILSDLWTITQENVIEHSFHFLQHIAEENEGLHFLIHETTFIQSLVDSLVLEQFPGYLDKLLRLLIALAKDYKANTLLKQKKQDIVTYYICHLQHESTVVRKFCEELMVLLDVNLRDY